MIHYLLLSLLEVFVFVFYYYYFKDWKHIRKFSSVSLNTLLYIEKKYSVNHDRIIIRSSNSSCRDNFGITCPLAQGAISSMHGQNYYGILHHSVTFSQRLTMTQSVRKIWTEPKSSQWIWLMTLLASTTSCSCSVDDFA